MGVLEFTASTFVNRANTSIILTDIKDVDELERVVAGRCRLSHLM
ncbi:hypothetical protein [Rhodococcus sp. HNM0563]|nr:hypothetical protein [Rhodococcus sp. HNM0563]